MHPMLSPHHTQNPVFNILQETYLNGAAACNQAGPGYRLKFELISQHTNLLVKVQAHACQPVVLNDSFTVKA